MKVVDYRSEAIARMNRRGVKTVAWNVGDRLIRFSKIPATAARNWDGSLAGSGNDPNQEILERMDWVEGFTPRFTNWW